MAVHWLEGCENWQKSFEVILKAIAVNKKYNFPPTYTALTILFKSAFGLGRWQEAREVQKYRFKPMVLSHIGQAFYSWRQGHLAYAHGRFKDSVKFSEPWPNTLTGFQE